MKTSRRIAWLSLVLGFGLLLGILFRAFILANFVLPVAIVLMLAWRLVQSVHQAFYWGALAALGVGLAFYRLVKSMEMDSDTPLPTPETIIKNISYWRLLIQLASSGGPAATSLKHELRRMLVAMYLAKQPEATSFGIYEALRLRQQPLPDSLYAFLFPDEAPSAKRSWSQRLERLVAVPGKWIQRRAGREKAAYYHSIEEALTFMEALMEIKHGDEYFDSSDR